MRLRVFLLICLVVTFSSHSNAQDATDPTALVQAIQSMNARLMVGSGVDGPADNVLLVERRKLVEQLIRTAPGQVKAISLDASTSGRVMARDASLGQIVERSGERTGRLRLTVGDNFKSGTAKSFYSLETTDGITDLRFTGAEPSMDMVHRQVVVTGIGTSTYVAAETVQLAPVAQPAEEAKPRVAAAPAPSIGLMTKGVQQVVALIVNMPGLTFPGATDSVSYWQAQFFGSSFPSLTTLWSIMSDGQTSAAGNVYGGLTLSQAYNCDQYNEITTAAIAAAQAASIDLSTATHIAVIFPASGCDYGALGDIGGGIFYSGGPLSARIWLPMTPGATTSTQRAGALAHEGGHNLGLGHGNSYDYGKTPIGVLDTANSSVTNTEYGDPYTTMGGSEGGGGYYAAVHRALFLNWFTNGTDYTEVTSNGTYTIAPSENASGQRALRVARASMPGAWVWVEYRQPLGPIDSGFPTSGSNVYQGVLLHYEDPYDVALRDYLVDMTATASPNNFQMSALVPGVTWSDPYSLLDIKTVSANATGVTVMASYDTPCAALTPSYTTTSALAATATTGSVTVTAPSSCSWQASTAAPWISFTSATSGSGNGSVTFNIAANTGSERESFVTIQRQSVAVIQQQSTGVSVVSISPVPGGGLSQTFTVNLSAPDATTMKGLTQVDIEFAPHQGYDAEGPTFCHVYVYGTPLSISLLDNKTNQFSGFGVIGSTAVVSNNACSVNVPGSSAVYNADGTGLTLTIPVTFSASSSGATLVEVVPSTSAGGTATIFGSWMVPGMPAIVSMSPSTIRQGFAGAFSAAGSFTHFSSSTAVASAAGISGSSIAAASANSVSGNLSVTSSATLGAQALTFKTGTETVAATMNVVAGTTTSSALTTSATSGYASTNFTLTATISGTSGTPSGSVTFYDGTTALSTVPLSGSALATLSQTLAVGMHTLTAAYSGDTVFIPSTSSATQIQVALVPITLSLAPSASPSLAGSPLVLTATLASSVSGTTPTGTVTFTDGSNALGTANIASGVATYTGSGLATGTHSFSASFAGTSSLSAALGSASVNVIDFAVTSSASTLAVTAGASSTATLTFTPGASGFAANIALTCTGAPASATCSFSPATATPGTAATTSVLTVTTTARSAADSEPGLPWKAIGRTTLACLLLLLPIGSRRLRVSCLLLVWAGAVLAGLSGCGGSSGGGGSTPTGTPAGSYPLVVTATTTANGQTLNHTTPITLTVN